MCPQAHMCPHTSPYMYPHTCPYTSGRGLLGSYVAVTHAALEHANNNNGKDAAAAQAAKAVAAGMYV